MRDFRLYVIIDTDIYDNYRDILKVTRKVILGGAEIVQLRTKSLTDLQAVKAARAMRKLARKHKTLFIINDRTDLARVVNADGVHLGEEDLPIKEARKILGNKKIVGRSAHTLKQAKRAQQQGADYIGIGPIFATTAKPEVSPILPQILTKIKKNINIPFVAIGGITLSNLGQVLQCGAERVAVCRDIITAKDIQLTAREFKKKLYKKG